MLVLPFPVKGISLLPENANVEKLNRSILYYPKRSRSLQMNYWKCLNQYLEYLQVAVSGTERSGGFKKPGKKLFDSDAAKLNKKLDRNSCTNFLLLRYILVLEHCRVT